MVMLILHVKITQQMSHFAMSYKTCQEWKRLYVRNRISKRFRIKLCCTSYKKMTIYFFFKASTAVPSGMANEWLAILYTTGSLDGLHLCTRKIYFV